MTELISRNYGGKSYEVIIKTDSKEHYDAAQEFARRLIDNSVVANKWIPVTERLPGNEKPVLAYYGFWHAENGGTALRYIGTLSYFCFDPQPHWQHESTGLKVTHWMPLPEPPKEGE